MPRTHINHEAHDVPILTSYDLVVALATAGHDETQWLITYEHAGEGSGVLHKGETVHVIHNRTTFMVKPPP